LFGVCKREVIGNRLEGQLIYEPKPNKYLSDLNIIDMSCGICHTFVLTSSGDIYGWGHNEFGQIGNGSDSDWQSFPIKINESTSEKFKASITAEYLAVAQMNSDNQVMIV
jgi:alpha-tubulin suppressor-like RCC1 family protein